MWKVTLTLYFKAGYVEDAPLLYQPAIEQAQKEFSELGSIQTYVERLGISPKEYLDWIQWGTVHSAKWIDDTHIECMVESFDPITQEKIVKDFETFPMEDTLYESWSPNGWSLKTSENYEFGLIDFRDSAIEVEYIV